MFYICINEYSNLLDDLIYNLLAISGPMLPIIGVKKPVTMDRLFALNLLLHTGTKCANELFSNKVMLHLLLQKTLYPKIIILQIAMTLLTDQYALTR